MATIPVGYAVAGRDVVAGHDGRIYAMAGAADYGNIGREAYAYTPGSNAWSRIPNHPLDHVGAAAASGSDHRLYTFGGFPWGDRNETFIYDEDANVWTQGNSQPDARYGAGAALASDGKIYVVGGTRNGIDTYFSSVIAYDPDAATWLTAPDMVNARWALSVVADVQGRVYAIGGQGPTGLLAVVERYDPNTNLWSVLAPLHIARAYAAATLGPDGRIYVIGGYVIGASGHRRAEDSSEIYDPVTGLWAFGPTLPTPDGGGGAVVGADDRIYYIEGTGRSVRALALLTATTPTETPTPSPTATATATPTPTSTRVARRSATPLAGTASATVTAKPASPGAGTSAAGPASSTNAVAGVQAVPVPRPITLPDTGTGADQRPPRLAFVVLALSIALAGLACISRIRNRT